LIVQSYLYEKEFEMKKLQSLSFRSILAVALAFGILAQSFHAAYASNGAFTWRNVTDTFEGVGTCSDPDGIYLISVLSTGTVQYVETENGYKFSLAENGTAYLEPIQADSSVTYSSHYNFQIQDRLSNGNSMYTYNFVDTALGSDGTREVFKITYHLVVTSNGLEREVDNFQWICN
jgi:hypothetical protein